jgi:hypothetical protein
MFCDFWPSSLSSTALKQINEETIHPLTQAAMSPYIAPSNPALQYRYLSPPTNTNLIDRQKNNTINAIQRNPRVIDEVWTKYAAAAKTNVPKETAGIYLSQLSLVH